MEYLTVITHIEPNQLNKKNGIRIDLLSSKTAKDFGRRNMKNINTKKLGLFPNFGNWGVGIHLRSLNPFFTHIIFSMEFSYIPEQNQN